MGNSRRRRQMPSPFASDPLADERGFDKRKLRQLCRQVERALTCALDDVGLSHLALTAVLPWPNSSRLLVAVQPTEDGVIDRDAILDELRAAKGELRMVVAEAIHRKRTPELCFEILLDPSET